MKALGKICIFLWLMYPTFLARAEKVENIALHPTEQDRNPYTVNGKVSGIKNLKKVRAVVLAYKVERDGAGNVMALELDAPEYQKELNSTGDFSFLLYGDSEYQIRLIAEGYKATPYPMQKKNVATGQAIAISLEAEKDDNILLIGTFRDKFGKTRLSNVNTILTDLETHAMLKGITNAKGECFFSVSPNSNYTLVGYKKKYFFSKVDTFSTQQTEDPTVMREILMEEVKKGQTTQVKGHFEVNEARITEEGAKNLEELFELILQNPGVQFELSCHLDSRGEDEYNMILSQKRAEAAVLYLVSKGINPAQLIPKGYGETKLLNGCANGVKCGASMHEQNRRIELTVMGFLE
ncbi:OmpA family protein [Flammeovirgaceae bacterium SG7u.111]|nr:OmpA family protein [Flammeovirgaceae bacterium SG7u.132]WPO38065.1 OmpA family protein [Flammeovirgaceae bacterium SG7u.111]